MTELEYGPLSRALLAEDHHQLRQLLSSGEDARIQAHMQERSLEGESPLHVAACWPQGLKLLFELGGRSAQALVNSRDARGSTPLHYALWLMLPTATSTLIDNGAFIILEKPFCMSLRPVVGVWCGAQSHEVVELLCQELSRRRREMHNLAMKHLSATEIQQFGLEQGEMLQENAFEVSRILESRLCEWPQHFQDVQPASLYHLGGMSLCVARGLMSAGFNEPNTLFHDYSPLMTLNAHSGVCWLRASEYFDLSDFFVGHGNDLYARYPLSACMGAEPLDTGDKFFRTVHHMAYNLGLAVQKEWAKENPISRSVQMLLVRILGEAVEDPCECFCMAKGGCTSASLFARGLLDSGLCSTHVECSAAWNCAMKKREFLSIRNVCMAVHESAPTVARTISMTFVRVCTFTRLGMKHTCCRYRYNDPHCRAPRTDAHNQLFRGEGGTVTWDILEGTFQPIQLMESEDITEIWEEDASLVEQLESLMADFETRYDELDVSFENFFYDHWWPRMNEIEAERDALLTQDLKAIYEIGVVLEY